MTNRTSARLALVLLSAGLATSAPRADAQQVLVVDDQPGPGVFSEIQPAVDASGPFDVVLVRSGTYLGFTVAGRSATVIADANATPFLLSPVSIQDLAPTDRVVVQGLRVSANAVILATAAMRLLNCAGPIWIEDCVIDGDVVTFGLSSRHGAVVNSCASVTFQRCTLQGGPPLQAGGSGTSGLIATSSTITLASSACFGGDAFTGFLGAAQPGGAGARVTGGFLYTSGSTFEGGEGGFASIFVGGAGAAGGDGLLANGAATILDCTFAGGAGGEGFPAGSPPGPDGAPIAGSGPVTQLAGDARHFTATSPVREGQTCTFVFQGVPGEIAATLYSLAPATPLFFPAFDGTLLLSFDTLDALVFAPIPPSGTLVATFPSPTLSPAFQGVTVFHQSCFVQTAPLDAFLGPAVALVHLDAGV